MLQDDLVSAGGGECAMAYRRKRIAAEIDTGREKSTKKVGVERDKVNQRSKSSPYDS